MHLTQFREPFDSAQIFTPDHPLEPEHQSTETSNFKEIPFENCNLNINMFTSSVTKINYLEQCLFYPIF